MSDKALRVSYGEYTYESVPEWAPLPKGWEWNHVVGVAVDNEDRIFAYNRSEHPIIVLDKSGFDYLDTPSVKILGGNGTFLLTVPIKKKV